MSPTTDQVILGTHPETVGKTTGSTLERHVKTTGVLGVSVGEEEV